MNNILLHKESFKGNHVVINESSTVHHLNKVLRIKVGKCLTVSDGEGEQYEVKVTNIAKDYIEASILSKSDSKRELEHIHLSLFQGLPKGSKMETIIQKTVELGVNEIHPVYMERSISVDNGKGDKKASRWQKIAEETLKQCKGSIIPTIHEPTKFSAYFDYLKSMDLLVFPYENTDNYSLKNLIEDYKKSQTDLVKASSNSAGNSDKKMDKDKNEDKIKIAVIIGPEGGFSKQEADKLISLSAKPVSLGKRILRTETAAIATIAMLIYEFEL